MINKSLPKLFMQAGTTVTGDLERSVVVCKNRPLIISFLREGTHGTQFRVLDFFTEEILACHAWPGGLGCAINVCGKIHIFGSTDWGTPNYSVGNGIIMSILADDFSPSTPVEVAHSSAGDVYWNCEITQRPDGFMMVTEQSQAGIRFMYSTNLYNWGAYGGCMNSPPVFYCAGPAIKYNNDDGKTYLPAIRLNTNGNYEVWVARSANLAGVGAFEWSNKQLIVPMMADDGVNTSDISLCEFGDITLLTYFVGSQNGSIPCEARRAIYPGRLDQLWAEFF